MTVVPLPDERSLVIQLSDADGYAVVGVTANTPGATVGELPTATDTNSFNVNWSFTGNPNVTMVRGRRPIPSAALFRVHL